MRRILMNSLAFGICSFANASIIVNTFDTTVNGWTSLNSNAVHTINGGNSGGFFDAIGITPGVSPILVAPERVSTSMINANGQEITFDLKVSIDNHPIGLHQTFAVFASLFGSLGEEVSVNIGSTYPGRWTTYTVDLNPDDWNVLPEDWESLLMSTQFRIYMIPLTYDGSFAIGLDNFRMPIPAPGSSALFTIGCLAIFRRRR